MFLEGGGREVEENGTAVQRSVQFTISRDESVTLNRDVTVALSTADDSATGNHNPLIAFVYGYYKYHLYVL